MLEEEILRFCFCVVLFLDFMEYRSLVALLDFAGSPKNPKNPRAMVNKRDQNRLTLHHARARV